MSTGSDVLPAYSFRSIASRSGVVALLHKLADTLRGVVAILAMLFRRRAGASVDFETVGKVAKVVIA